MLLYYLHVLYYMQVAQDEDGHSKYLVPKIVLGAGGMVLLLAAMSNKERIKRWAFPCEQSTLCHLGGLGQTFMLFGCSLIALAFLVNMLIFRMCHRYVGSLWKPIVNKLPGVSGMTMWKSWTRKLNYYHSWFNGGIKRERAQSLGYYWFWH